MNSRLGPPSESFSMWSGVPDTSFLNNLLLRMAPLVGLMLLGLINGIGSLFLWMPLILIFMFFALVGVVARARARSYFWVSPVGVLGAQGTRLLHGRRVLFERGQKVEIALGSRIVRPGFQRLTTVHAVSPSGRVRVGESSEPYSGDYEQWERWMTAHGVAIHREELPEQARIRVPAKAQTRDSLKPAPYEHGSIVGLPEEYAYIVSRDGWTDVSIDSDVKRLFAEVRGPYEESLEFTQRDDWAPFDSGIGHVQFRFKTKPKDIAKVRMMIVDTNSREAWDVFDGAALSILLMQKDIAADIELAEPIDRVHIEERADGVILVELGASPTPRQA